jgi:hypothetical protein
VVGCRSTCAKVDCCKFASFVCTPRSHASLESQYTRRDFVRVLVYIQGLFLYRELITGGKTNSGGPSLGKPVTAGDIGDSNHGKEV